MPEQVNISNSKKKIPSINRLTEKKEALEKALKATIEALEAKQAAKRAKEQEQAKKNRTKALILLGLYTIDSFLKTIENVSQEQAINATNEFCTYIATYYKNKNEQLQSLQKDKEKNNKKIERLKNEMLLILNFIKPQAEEIINQKKNQSST